LEKTPEEEVVGFGRVLEGEMAVGEREDELKWGK
jgi:hypothetical protein